MNPLVTRMSKRLFECISDVCESRNSSLIACVTGLIVIIMVVLHFRVNVQSLKCLSSERYILGVIHAKSMETDVPTHFFLCQELELMFRSQLEAEYFCLC